MELVILLAIYQAMLVVMVHVIEFDPITKRASKIEAVRVRE